MDFCDWKCRLLNMWKSKTVWFNAIWATLLTGFGYFSESYMMLREYTTPETFQVFVIVNFVGNLVLRVLTHLDLKDK